MFRVDGSISQVLDGNTDLHPNGVLKYEYGGTPARLFRVVDTVTGRIAELQYWNVNNPNVGACVVIGAFTVGPYGSICRIDFSDGRITDVQYNGGQISWITNRGNATTRDAVYGFNWYNGKVIDTNAPFESDQYLAQVGLYNEPTANTTKIVYDAVGRVLNISEPARYAGGSANRQGHSYVYTRPSATGWVREDVQSTWSIYAGNYGQTLVQMNGYSGPLGFARLVAYDSRLRTVLDIGTANTNPSWDNTWFYWSDNDELRATFHEPTGLFTTNVYDDMSRITDTYGPAAKSCFTGYTPTAACNAAHSRTVYDGMVSGASGGLAATWWNNNNYVGAPTAHSYYQGNGASLVSNFGVAAPGPTNIGADNFSAQFTGYVNLTAVGNYDFQAAFDDGIRLWIDDIAVIDGFAYGLWGDSGRYLNSRAGWHRIRLDYFEGTGGASFSLNWKPPGGASVPVPLTALQPGYETSPEPSLTVTPALRPKHSTTTEPNHKKVYSNQSGSIRADSTSPRHSRMLTLPASPCSHPKRFPAGISGPTPTLPQP